MAFAKEYSAKLTLNLDQVRKTERAQRAIYDSGIVNPNQNQLITGLTSASGVLSTFLAYYGPTSLALAIFSLVGTLVPNEKSALQSMVNTGYWELGYLEDFLVDHPQYDLIEVNLPFIEYETAGVRFITGRGAVTRVHTSGGWILL